MALIKCIECGKEISSFSDKCSNCGCPTSLTVFDLNFTKIESEKYSRKIALFSEVFNDENHFDDVVLNDLYIPNFVIAEFMLVENRKNERFELLVNLNIYSDANSLLKSEKALYSKTFHSYPLRKNVLQWFDDIKNVSDFALNDVFDRSEPSINAKLFCPTSFIALSKETEITINREVIKSLRATIDSNYFIDDNTKLNFAIDAIGNIYIIVDFVHIQKPFTNPLDGSEFSITERHVIYSISKQTKESIKSCLSNAFLLKENKIK